jgi:glycosyltransferase involved in cell wall biosynthesis
LLRPALRVLYVNPFSQQVSGPDESLRALLRPLMAHGVEPHLVLPRPGPQVPLYEEMGVRIHYAPISVLRRRLAPIEVARFGPDLIRGAASLVGIARKVRAELIHTNMEVVFDGALAARWLRLPHILHYRGNSLDQPRRVFDALTLAWTTLSDRIFCISGATAEIFRRRRRAAKVSTLYNPIDLAAYATASRSAEVRRALGAADGDTLIGTVGRIHPRKDLQTFVEAAALAAEGRPRARFVIVGAAEGAAEEAYLDQVRATSVRLGIAERLLFAGARRDMPATFKAMDVFVLSSRHEGFGRVVAEAMAAGVPSVVTREGALPELIADGVDGFTAAPAVPGDFASKMSRLIDDPALRERLGAAARQRAAAFDAETCAARVLETYQALCAGAAAHRS